MSKDLWYEERPAKYVFPEVFPPSQTTVLYIGHAICNRCIKSRASQVDLRTLINAYVNKEI